MNLFRWSFCKREKLKEAYANRAIVVCFLKKKGGNYMKKIRLPKVSVKTVNVGKRMKLTITVDGISTTKWI